MRGRVDVQSLLYAVKLSFEALFNIRGEETLDSRSAPTYSAGLETEFTACLLPAYCPSQCKAASISPIWATCSEL